MPPPQISAENLLQHQEWLFRFVRKLVQDDFTADDMVQATFTEALANPNAGKTNLPAWLASTARRLTAQDWRSNSRRKNREDRMGVSDEAVVKQSAELSELFQVTNSALRDLPEPERVVLMLRHMQGWKPQAIAKELNLPLEVVYRHAEHGCNKLRGRLKITYGQEWQASCLAILVLPKLQKSISLTAVGAGLAASLAVIAAGIWGFTSMGANPEDLALADSVGHIAVENEDTPLLSALVPFEPNRTNMPGLISDLQEIQVQMLSPDGSPYAEGWVRMNWMAGKNQPEGYTNSDGFLSLEVPLDAEGIFVNFGGINLYGKKLHLQEDAWGERIILQLVKGTILVSFQTIKEEEGQVLNIQGGSTWLGFDEWSGFCRTDSRGLAEAYLPAPGRYDAWNSLSGSKWGHVKFYVGPEGFPHPIPVIFKTATEYNLVVKDKVSGGLIDHAKFFIASHNQDDKNHIHEEVVSELPSTRGRLAISGSELPDPRFHVRISAEGYATTYIRLQEPHPEEILIELNPIEWVPATLLSSQNGIRFTSLFLYEDNGGFNYPSSSTNHQYWGAYTKLELVVTPEGQFELPRIPNSTNGSFKLVALDEQGREWIAKDLDPPDRIGTHLEFAMTPEAPGHTVVKISGARPASTSVSYRSYLGGPSNARFSDTVPDENQELHYSTQPGSRVAVSYWEKNLHFELERWLPAGEDSATFLAEIPQGSATLEGLFYGPDGQFLPDGTSVGFRLSPEDSSSIEGSKDSVLFSVSGRIQDGQVILKDCPSGEYQYSPSPVHGDWMQTVQTGTPFVVRYPETQGFTVQVFSDSGSNLLTANFLLSNIPSPYQPCKSYGDFSSASGFLFHAFPKDFDQSYLLVSAFKHQPQAIPNLLPGQTQQIVLKPGRSLRVHLDELEVAHHETHRWICDAWGDADDPRQLLIRVVDRVIRIRGAPFEAVRMIELDENDHETGIVIHVDSSGLAELMEQDP